jgi:glutamine synthetase
MPNDKLSDKPSKNAKNLINPGVLEFLKQMRSQEVVFVDLRFTDIKGKEHHMTVPSTEINESFFEHGKMFDGSSFVGWKPIHESDMILKPDMHSAVLDPFFDAQTLILRCDVIEPDTLQGYECDPRSVAQKAEQYLISTGIADKAYFGPEPEFFIFDNVRWGSSVKGSFFELDSSEMESNSENSYPEGNMGHRPALKGGYVPLPPVDSLHELRSEMAEVLTQMGLVVEAHHHEVAMAQCEIATRYNTLVKRADENQVLKYVVHNVAHRYGKTATFMPKPLVGDNGSGMHVHQSLFKDGKNLFAGDEVGGLSQNALYYIGGIIKHAKALNAFTNPTTNSYKRLVPGFEAPVLLAYSARNRSASIRIPYVSEPQARRIEVRFPDPAANPYFAFSAMMMAGLDGIKHKIHPGDAMNKDLYELPKSELAKIPHVAASLDEALSALEKDMGFLLEGGVFTESLIETYIQLKRLEAQEINMAVHPLELKKYYSV